MRYPGILTGGLLLSLFLSLAQAAEEPETGEARLPELQDQAKKVPESSFQNILVGSIVRVDRRQNSVTILDPHRRQRTFYVEPGLLASFSGGDKVQIRLQLGSNRVESIQKRMG